MKTCIYIPIKTLNKRLPGKTFKLLNKRPLYSYLFNTIKKLKLDVYIDSSDDKIEELAKKNGFNFLKRPEEYNADNIAGNDLLMRVIDKLDYDLIVFLHITSPFLSAETINKAIKLMEKNPKLDSLFGVVSRYNRFWYDGKPINHSLKKLVRTQDLIPVKEEAADCYFVRKNSFKKYKRRVCGKFGLLEVSKVEATDIDNLEDFIYAEALIKAGIVNQKTK